MHLRHRYGNWVAGTRVETAEGLNTTKVEEPLWISACTRCGKRRHKPRPGIRFLSQGKFEEVK